MTSPAPPVWVLEDPRPGTRAQALGIAERLGMPFRRIALDWNWKAPFAAMSGATLGRRGSLMGLGVPDVLPRETPPALVISAGTRSAAVALWLRARHGCRVVHCMRPQVPLRSWLSLRHQFDLLVMADHDNPPQAPNVFPIRGVVNRLSPARLEQARRDWSERLAHLPHPRVALLVGGPMDRWYRGADLNPALAHHLARRVAGLVAEVRGCVLATTSRRTGREAADAIAAGLGPAMHVLYRWGEPGENPYAGFLASADAVIVTADSVSMLSEACGVAAPVFVALPQLAGPRHRRMIGALGRAGQVRSFTDNVSPWPRVPLDETGRVAAEIRLRFADCLKS